MTTVAPCHDNKNKKQRSASYHVVERRYAGERLAAQRVGGELAEGRRHGHGGRWAVAGALCCAGVGASTRSRVWEVVELVAFYGVYLYTVFYLVG